MKIQRHSLFFHPHVTKIIVGSVNISSITCCVFCCCKFHSQLDRSIRKNLNKIDIHIVAILSGCNGWILASLLSCIVLKTFLHTPTRTLIHSNRYVFGSSGKNSEENTVCQHLQQIDFRRKCNIISYYFQSSTFVMHIIGSQYLSNRNNVYHMLFRRTSVRVS